MDSIQVYDAKLSTRTKLNIIKTIRQQLSSNPDRLKLFKNTVFGQWLHIKSYEHDNHLLHYLLQHQRYVENPNLNTPMYFDIWGHSLEFCREDMCLVLGFRFGDDSLDHLKKHQSGFGKRILTFLKERRTEKISNIKADQLFQILTDTVEFDELSNDDVVRLCILLFLENIFMGKQERKLISNEILVLVDDFYAWNTFPWGEYIWIEFHKKIYNAISKVRDRHLLEIATKGHRYIATYTLCGFAFALKIWLLESYHNSKYWWNKEDNVIPRGVAWADGHRFEKTDYDLLFRNTEMDGASSVDYFKKCNTRLYPDITPTPAIVTPAVNRSCRRAKLTPGRRTHAVVTPGLVVRANVHRNVIQDMPYMGEHLKPDGVCHIPIMDEELPPSVTVFAQMSHMQRQIDELHKYIKNLKHDGVSEKNDGSSNTARAFVEKAVLGSFIYWVASERIFDPDGVASQKRYMIVSFDIVNHIFSVIDIPDRLRVLLPVPFYISNLRESLVIFGNMIGNQWNTFFIWQIKLDGVKKIKSFKTLFNIFTPHLLKLIGITSSGDPILESDQPYQMDHTLQVFQLRSQEFINLPVEADAGSCFMSPYNESLLLLTHPDCSTGNIDVDLDSKPTGVDAMDVDVNANLKSQEDILSNSGKDLSTQEVPEVIFDLFGSPEDPTCGQDDNVCDTEQVMIEPETKDPPFIPVGVDEYVGENGVTSDEKNLHSPSNMVGAEFENDQSMEMQGLMSNDKNLQVGPEFEHDRSIEMQGVMSQEKNLQVDTGFGGDEYVEENVVMSDEKNLQSPSNMVRAEFEHDQSMEMQGVVENLVKVNEDVEENVVMSEAQNSESPFNLDVLLFGDEEHVPPMDVKSEYALSLVIGTPANVKYVESIDCDDNKVTTVRVPFQRERKVSKVYQDPYMQQPFLVNHIFSVIDIPDRLRVLLPVPFYISNLRESLVIFGNMIGNQRNTFFIWQIKLDGVKKIKSFKTLFNIFTPHLLKLIGITSSGDPILEFDQPYQMDHTLQVFQLRSQEFINLPVEADAGPPTGVDAMDVDVNANLKSQEDIFSNSGKDLSTQEVPEVIFDLFGSPEDPTCGQVGVDEYVGENGVTSDEKNLHSPSNMVGAEFENDQSMEMQGVMSNDKNLQVDTGFGGDEYVEENVVMSDEKNLHSPSNMVRAEFEHDQSMEMQGVVENLVKVNEDVEENVVMSEAQNSESPFNPDVLLFGDEEHVPPMDVKSEYALSPVIGTPANVKYVESIDCDDNNVTTVRVPFQRERKYVESIDCDDNNVTTVRVPFQRERKVSKVYQDPYMQQPSTTPRRRIKRYLKVILPKVIGPDGKEIILKPWKEVMVFNLFIMHWAFQNLCRSGLGTMFKAFVHPEIQVFLDSKKKNKIKRKNPQLFLFPWGNANTTADYEFWLGLLGRDEGSRGWLGDVHIGLWVDFLMHFRPVDANWVMVGPFFATMILQLKMPLYYANGVTNDIPWFREGVEKVFFPINQPDTHWCLGELDIKTGVITLYDSLGGNASEDYVEKRVWWQNFRSVFSCQLPKYLVESEVMQMKNIESKNYHVSFKYARDILIQGGSYGDCGVWVCIFLYKLSHNLSLKVRKPVQAALAYREYLAEFYWKYKIPFPNENKCS
ncbi:phospholipase-like, Aminotransferase-like mobile domain protein [Artemisia annua]|uniref:Phospholipase-like, Aminotransferase-like mobile domain protein n=1 Tax=Artemisia annua TaxID=35608 RepID=A0A2U1NT62_ARTAN|nr:phospholipase-like, Aminotransferase-like mobile domain protein [Artemisia annua]